MTTAKMIDFAKLTTDNAEQAMHDACSTHEIFQSFLPEGINMETVQSVVHAQEKMTEYMVNLTVACNPSLPEEIEFSVHYLPQETHPAGTHFSITDGEEGFVTVSRNVRIDLAKYTTVISD